MPIYHRLGSVPAKRHTQFRRPDGRLYTEELFGTSGFSGCSSILYHNFLPPAAHSVSKLADLTPVAAPKEVYHHRHLRAGELPAGGDAVTGRRVLLFNGDVSLSFVTPLEQMDYFYRNGQSDELLFVHEGAGVLRSTFGTLPFGSKDYLVIPRGTTYRLDLEQVPARLLVIEGRGPLETPRRYRNEFGQLLEHSPYCERDIRRPEQLETHEEQGDFEIRVKVGDRLMGYRFKNHPFDVVGWDGYVYPWALNVGDFEPITGRIHQPPPVHQTFQAPGFVVCSFVPRKLDYHPTAVPIPYNHSNVDYDEVLYYVSGSFGSRRGIDVSSLTLHPRGLPHGPQPGLVEASLGRESTDELAVMLDATRPLALTPDAVSIDDQRYPFSWTT